MILVKSLTNMGEIGSKLKVGVGDLFLIPKYSAHLSRVSFLYGNFYVEVSHWEHKDISALSDEILKIMQDNSRLPATGKPAPIFALAADKNKIKTGDSFSIKAKGLTADWSTDWIYSPSEDLLPDTVEFSEQDGEIFTFKALKKGAANIRFTAINKRNLLLYVEAL